MNYYEIGQKIRKYRKACGMSQEFLAEKVGISVTHMSHIETGNTKLSLPVLVSLAEALEVRTDDILFNYSFEKNNSVDEINELLNSCSTKQLRVILDLIKSTKSSLIKYYEN